MNPPALDYRVKQQIKQQDLLVKIIASVSQKLHTAHLSASHSRLYVGNYLLNLLSKALIPEGGREGGSFGKPVLFAD